MFIEHFNRDLSKLLELSNPVQTQNQFAENQFTNPTFHHRHQKSD